jgi:hypothetical protein
VTIPYPLQPSPPQRVPEPSRVKAVLVIVGVFVLAGVVSGLVWPHLVPQVQMVMTDLGPFPVDETEAGQLMVMDGTYAGLAGVLGLVLGTTLFMIFQRRGPAIVIALAVGAGLAAALALTVGSFSSGGELVLAWQPRAEVGTQLDAPLGLHAYGVMLIWPIASLAPIVPLVWLTWRERWGAERVVHTSHRTDEPAPPPVQ